MIPWWQSSKDRWIWLKSNVFTVHLQCWIVLGSEWRHLQELSGIQLTSCLSDAWDQQSPGTKGEKDRGFVYLCVLVFRFKVACLEMTRFPVVSDLRWALLKRMVGGFGPTLRKWLARGDSADLWLTVSPVAKPLRWRCASGSVNWKHF